MRAVDVSEVEAASGLPLWEYDADLLLRRVDSWDTTLDEYGAESWELVAIIEQSDDRVRFVFKRELELDEDETDV